MTGIHNTIKKSSASQKGFTLVETIIAMGLFSILVAIAVGGFINALRTQRQVGDLIAAQSTVSLAIEQMAREARTGYLFCHPDDGKLNDSPSLAVCGCQQVGHSGSGNTYPVWQCSALNFLNANSVSTTYSLASGTLMRSNLNENAGVAQPLTGSDVTVRALSFTLRGQLEGDGSPPLITIVIGISPSSTDQAVASTTLYFETSVSARQMDCSPTPPIKC
ncbi:MAG TPA: type II secretion system protein [Candidatus Paceibacterota bacterium]|nr:type II secretion system protein [Candidatus Paceibacterota bacterium]